MTSDDAEDEARAHYRALSDEELIRALRNDESPAFVEFVLRYQPALLAQARRAGIPRAERRDWVIDLLHDVALKLVSARQPIRRSLQAYLLAACRYRAVNQYRAAERRHRQEAAAEIGVAEGDGRLLLDGCSQYSLRVSEGAADEAASLSPALHRLASMLDCRLTAEEQRILNWVSRCIPQREIAASLGISHMAAAQRIGRLRKRLREVAVRYAGTLRAEERAELYRFFRRSAVVPSARAEP